MYMSERVDETINGNPSARFRFGTSFFSLRGTGVHEKSFPGRNERELEINLLIRKTAQDSSRVVACQSAKIPFMLNEMESCRTQAYENEAPSSEMRKWVEMEWEDAQ